jgi:preprotein translocase subunit SecG
VADSGIVQRHEEERVKVLSKTTVVVALLLAALLITLNITACGFTSQGSQEQRRPAEVQKPASEETEKTSETPQKTMEETGKEEQTERGTH